MTAKVRLQVAAGILIDNGGRILLTERIGDASFAGLWEFPGGKLHSGETAEQALFRELHEELAINVRAARPFMSLSHDYEDRSVDLEFFLIDDWAGEPLSCDGQALQWLSLNDIEPAMLLPADAPVLNALHKKIRSSNA